MRRINDEPFNMIEKTIPDKWKESDNKKMIELISMNMKAISKRLAISKMLLSKLQSDKQASASVRRNIDNLYHCL